MFRVLREGDNRQDRLFALLTLGTLGTAEAHEALLPYLDSSVVEERWASAICLGELREVQALPVLMNMLMEVFSPAIEYQRGGLLWHWREAIPVILGEWGERVAVVPLRHALVQVLQVQRTVRNEAADAVMDGEEWEWQDYADVIVYALGQLKAIAALTGIETEVARLDVLRIQLILGYLHGRYPIVSTARWNEQPELARDVNELLETLFGLDREERKRSLHQYEVEKAFDMVTRYKREFVEHKRLFEDWATMQGFDISPAG